MANDFGIYIHTPWCKTRCPYCAFNVYLSDSSDYERWKQNILIAWKAVSAQLSGKAHSLYFGGGTPSLAPPQIIAELVEALPLQSTAEITLEANPGTVDRRGLENFKHAGVNRLSIGVQTFNRQHARTLGRGHTVDQAKKLLRSANKLGFQSWSMDLMFALPDQTEDELAADLEELLRVGPPHVSLYGLSIEPKTPFQRAHDAGRFTLPESDEWRRMYDRVVTTLEKAKLERYEVSNFAQKNHRAVHNERVWRGGYYAGLGPGAHGFLPDGTRTMGHQSLEAWYTDPRPKATRPGNREAAIDYLLSSLRHTDGTSTALLQERTGYKVADKDIKILSKASMVYEKDHHIRLTQAGFPLADGILSRLIEGMELAKAT